MSAPDVYEVAEVIAASLDALFDDEGGVFYSARVAGWSSSEAMLHVAATVAETEARTKFLVLVIPAKETAE